LHRATQLNPLAAVIYLDLGDSYLYLRRYGEALATYDSALKLNVGSTETNLQKALAYLSQTGDREGTQRLMPDLRQPVAPVGGPTGVIGLADLVPLLSREQQEVLLHVTPEAFVGDTGGWALARAMVYRALGQDASARSAFESARTVFERRLAVRPDDHLFLAELGFALAGLGRGDEAASQGMRAVEARPISRDAVDGPLVLVNLARIYTLLGRADAAIDQLQLVLSKPGPLSPGWLRADPFWAPLRGNPRFERLVAGN
jgi:tetratricopeptide (TPR) repeat protein